MSVENQNFKKYFRFFLKITTGVVFLIFVIGGLAAAYDRNYKGRVYPGVYFAEYPVGGLTAQELVAFLENLNNRLSKEGVTFMVNAKAGAALPVKMSTVGAGDSAVELVQFDSLAGVKNALLTGRTGSWWSKLFAPLAYQFIPPRLPAPITASDAALNDALRGALASFEDKPHNATLKVSVADPNNPTLIPEAAGQVFDYNEVASELKQQLSRLSFDSIPLKRHQFVPTVTSSDVESVLGHVPRLLSFGNLNLNFIDPENKLRHDWPILPATWVEWLDVRRGDAGVVIGLNQDAVQNYLEAAIRPAVDVNAADAKFVMEDGKVQEFQASRSGLKLNIAKTAADLDTVFQERNFEGAHPAETISVSVDIAEPAVKTAEVNDLGITGILGFGVSTFHDSHTNRIKNIARAISKLNGVLIKPGENFSTLAHIGPFTPGSGYLPELVIKGKEIKPEIGGGMCQIGTTMFRLAMNSGLDITERRNHSLVVHYYADPVNRNPGTDATVYDPAPDFKFINDTGNYLLLQTEIDYVKQQLTFTLWGKPDGRSGSYTHPTVSKWIPAGEPVETLVTDGSLKPGAKKCQEAFRGAVASFTYTRYTSSSQKIDRVFESYYRPLPKTCMVGALPGSASSTPGGEAGVEVIPIEAAN